MARHTSRFHITSIAIFVNIAFEPYSRILNQRTWTTIHNGWAQLYTIVHFSGDGAGGQLTPFPSVRGGVKAISLTPNNVRVMR